MNLFDYTYIDEITNNDKELKIEIISVIITTLPSVIFDFQAQTEKMDLEKISETAHKLKSSAKMLLMDSTLPEILFLEESDLKLIDSQIIIDNINFVSDNFNKVLNELSLELDKLEQDS